MGRVRSRPVALVADDLDEEDPGVAYPGHEGQRDCSHEPVEATATFCKEVDPGDGDRALVASAPTTRVTRQLNG
ncbi:MAG: hypothetical protein WBP81_25985 [Solirubrobacteraceae bacterium]